MSSPEPLSREVLDRARAYLRVDRQAIDALPELVTAIGAFRLVPSAAGESAAAWLAERALREPQEATVRVRLSHVKVTGVYALCAAQIAPSSEERAQLGGVHDRIQPAMDWRTDIEAAVSGGSPA